jgi:serine/threonine protein kinase/outer membrane protein assembly factor BamB
MSSETCPTREQLSGYIKGTLPSDAAESVAAHLETCGDCEDTLSAMEQQGDTLLHNLRQPDSLLSELESPECRRAIEAAEAACLGGKKEEGAFPSFASAEMGLSPSAAEPRRLGEYELLAELGRGGMGHVYKARQTLLGKIVALKVLPKSRTSDPRAVARFKREIAAIGKLSHPNIVQALDARDIDGTTVLVMEYVDGIDLAKLIKGNCPNFRLSENGTVPFVPLPIADACELVRQAAVGLQCIHESGLVHRDIKPSNLMLTPQGQVKILDLGLALLGPEHVNGKELTGDGLAMGTPDYIAPEQAGDCHNVDIRADVYSLGCTLYHLLTGRAPFSGPNYKTPFDKTVAHARDTAPPVKSLRADVPDELSSIVERMMAKDLAERFAMPAEVAAILTPYVPGADLSTLLMHVAGDQSSGPAVAAAKGVLPTPSRRRSRRAIAIALKTLGAVLLLAIAIRIVIEIWDPKPPPPKPKPLVAGWCSERCDLGKTSFYPWASKQRTTRKLKPYTWRAPEPVDTISAVSTGDINGDGRLEIVTADGDTLAAYDPWGKELWRQNPVADSRVHVPAGRVGRISPPILDDFDQNGSPELLLLAGSRIEGHGTTKGPLSVVAYDGQGKVVRRFAVLEGQVASPEPPFDFNGDGRPDVVFTTGAHGHPHALCIHDYDTGDSLWQADFADGPALSGVGMTNRKDPDLFVTIPYPCGADSPVGDYDSEHAYAVLFDARGQRLWKQEFREHHSLDASMADLDADGKNDLILLDNAGDAAKLYLLDPKDGRPMATLDGLQRDTHRAWSIADVNGDGRKEIILGDGKKLYVIDGKARILSSKEAVDTQVMATNDLDGDGAIEILARQGQDLVIFDGRLAEIARFRAAGKIQSAIISDLDGDGINEVLLRTGELKKCRLEIVHFEPDVTRSHWTGLNEKQKKRL